MTLNFYPIFNGPAENSAFMTATFLEQFESSPYEIKVNISYEKAIEFLKMITDFSLIINSPNFHRMNIKLQLYVVSTQIILKLRENHQNVGQNLIGIVNKFSNYCRRIDGNGMFMSMSEFINKKMTENIEQFTKRHKNWNVKVLRK
uniref:Uncharacterized protein n=1 Tax=Globodera pallida TaxID=36090 RepID=A0A183CCN4_GLOPA